MSLRKTPDSQTLKNKNENDIKISNYVLFQKFANNSNN